MTTETKKSILFVQHGDFAEAYRRFANGGEENYRDQKASVDFVSGLAPDAKVMTFSFGVRGYHTKLGPELWAAGASHKAFTEKKIANILEKAEVTHMVLRTPHVGFLRVAARFGIKVLPSFADVFSNGGLRNRYQNWKLRRALMQCQTPCYSNHSLNASRSLVNVLRLPPERVVPMDRDKLPLAGDAKSGVGDPKHPTAFYAGTLSEAKGVGDCLEAVASLRAQGIFLRMSFAGSGEISRWQARAMKLGITEQVNFLGLLPNAQVRAEMRHHDFVIVPSRHSYQEGLPNTLCEGLVSRSVVIVSDHPAFSDRLVSGKDCLIFAAANPTELAACLKRATFDSNLYQQLSENATNAHDRLYVGMEWTALVTAFLNDPDDLTGWVERNSLKSIDSFIGHS